MLFTTVYATTRSGQSSDESTISFMNLADVFGPIMMKLRLENESNEELFEYLKSCARKYSLYVEGFSIDNDETVTSLLDSGLHVAFFNAPSSNDSIAQKVLGSLPRSRIGISLTNVIVGREVEIFNEIVQSNKHSVSHFYFK
jgi:hypothetical protein